MTLQLMTLQDWLVGCQIFRFIALLFDISS